MGCLGIGVLELRALSFKFWILGWRLGLGHEVMLWGSWGLGFCGLGSRFGVRVSAMGGLRRPTVAHDFERVQRRRRCEGREAEVARE